MNASMLFFHEHICNRHEMQTRICYASVYNLNISPRPFFCNRLIPTRMKTSEESRQLDRPVSSEINLLIRAVVNCNLESHFFFESNIKLNY